MTGKQLSDGTCVVISPEVSDLAKRVKASGRRWPWDLDTVMVGDARLGIAWPFTDERQAGIYKAGFAVLCVMDASDVIYVLRREKFFGVRNVMRTLPKEVSIVLGLRSIVSECMMCGVTRFAVQSDRLDMARSYVRQLHDDVPGADRVSYDQIADISTCCSRLTSRASIGQLVQLSEDAVSIGDDRKELGGRPGPLEIATAICASSYEYTPLRVHHHGEDLKSLYPLPKGAQVFGA